MAVMPWASRIQSEATRRWVVAAIMAALLAAATGGAVWMSRAAAPTGRARVIGPGGVRRSGERIDLVRERLGWLRIKRPAGWSANYTPSVEGELLQPLALFAESGGVDSGGRYLSVEEYTSPHPLSPRAALGVVENFLPPTQWSELWSVRSTGMFGAIARGAVRDRGGTYEQVVAVLTADGMRYAVLNLTGLARSGSRSVEQMRRIALAAKDLRYEAVSSSIRLGGVAFDLPRPLVAYTQPDRPDAALLISPKEIPRFVLLSVESVPLTGDGPDTRTLERMPQRLRNIFQAERSTDQPTPLLARMVVRYWRTQGRAPPSRSATPFQAHGRGGFVLPMSEIDQRSGGTYRAMWGVEIGDERAMILELAAASDVKPQATAAAKLLTEAVARASSKAPSSSEAEGE